MKRYVAIKAISPKAMSVLCNHSYPGKPVSTPITASAR